MELLYLHEEVAGIHIYLVWYLHGFSYFMISVCAKLTDILISHSSGVHGRTNSIRAFFEGSHQLSRFEGRPWQILSEN